MNVYSNITKIYGMENITTEEVMDRLNMYQAIFGKLDEFGWCDMERIKTDAGTQLTSKYFQERLYVRLVLLALVVQYYK